MYKTKPISLLVVVMFVMVATVKTIITTTVMRTTAILTMNIIMTIIFSTDSYGQIGSSVKTVRLNGFTWYDDEPLLPKPAANDNQPQPATNKVPAQTTAEQRIANLTEQLEQAIARAIDNPNYENVVVAQKLQLQVIAKSQSFAKMWQIAATINPLLTDHNEHHNILHRKIYQQQQSSVKAVKLKRLSKNYGLLLQIHPNCPFSLSFAPIVKHFAANYNFQILAASNNGGDFLGIVGIKDRGQLQILNPEYRVPALYLVHSSGNIKQTYPIAWGIIDEDLIIANIFNLASLYPELESELM